MKKYILVIGLIIGIISTTEAYVDSVKYLIEYNYSTNLYDCKVVIIEGIASSSWQRKQYNSQFSILVPKGSQVSAEKYYNPLKNNHSMMGTEPCKWQIGLNPISPVPESEHDYYTIFPYTTPTCYYNTLFEGDTVTLFSLLIDADPCEGEVRLFENGVDLEGVALNANYENGFKIGNENQTYLGNLFTPYEERNFFENDILIICKNDCINLNPILLCSQDNLKFEWSTGETTQEIEVCPETSSNYYLLIKDSTDNLLDSLSVFVGFEEVAIEAMEICVNDTTIASSIYSGGIWKVDSPSVATIDPNTGDIIGRKAGETRFKYLTPEGCVLSTDILRVNPIPEITVDGEITVCLGEFVTVSSSTNGTWFSSDTTIATVSADGLVETLNLGSVEITFIDDITGCSSECTKFFIFETASAALIGPNTICSGQTTQLSYPSGGNWSIAYSSNPIVATHDNFGNVTGITEGKIVFEFINYVGACESVYSDTVYVLDNNLSVSYIGDDRICKGGTTSVFPNTGGTWTSNHPDFATIDTFTGFITGIEQGTASFTFTDSITGCTATTTPLVIYSLPATDMYIDSICINTTTIVFPWTGGVWSSMNPEVATVDSNIVTGISHGDAALIFTSDNTGCKSNPLMLNVGSSQATLFLGQDDICVGEHTNIFPTTGGTWTSSDENIATIDNEGKITGIAPGEATFLYIGDDSLCITEPSEPVYVHEFPEVSLGSSVVCISETMNLEPSSGGSWVTNNPEIASVNYYTGVVTAKALGTATFTYTSNSSGCSSTTESVTILPSPFVVSNPVEACPGEETNLSINLIGSWVSEDSNIATVDESNGTITAVSYGSTVVTFTEASTGCSVDVEVEVLEPPMIYLWGNNVCVGQNAQLAASAFGTWISEDPSIATVNIAGKITAEAPGQTTFIFSEDNGCSSKTEDFVVLPLSDPMCIVGVEEVDENVISVYPNPARELVFIESELEIESISIYTMEFQKVESVSFSNGMRKSQISIEDLTQGLYFLAIQSKDKTMYKKIIVE